MPCFRLLVSASAAVLMVLPAVAQTAIDSVAPSARAKFIRASDVSPEEYQRILAEAEKVRAYNSTQTYTQSYTQPYVTQSTVAPITQPTIEIYDAPVSTYSYDAGTTYQPSVVNYQTGGTIPTSTTTYATTSSLSGHSVVKGDTLYSISRRYGVTLKDLKATNGKSDNTISVGEYLQIPGQYQAYQAYQTSSIVSEPVTTISSPTLVRTVEPIPSRDIYAVLPGDTFYSIARQSCLSVSELSSVNISVETSSLQPGQLINLPSGHCLR